MIEFNVKQRSKEWFKLRLGKITGTRLKQVFKSDNLTLIDELIAEEITQEVPESFVNDAMQRGIDLEPLVIELFQKVHNIEIDEVGYLINEKYDFIGLSPDGLSKDRKVAVEIKCPNTKTHVKYIRQAKIPNEYKYQIYHYFIVNEQLEKLYFVSFDDRFTAKPYFEVVVKREDIQDELNDVIAKLIAFNDKKNKIYKQITQ